MSTLEAGVLPPGTRLRDRYIIERVLGQGGFGITYLAQDIGRFNEAVAIKELTPLTQGTTSLQKAEELFEREAAILYKLNHPQIPRFWEFFREQKRLFLAQDYIAGETYHSLLKQRTARGTSFSEAEIMQLLRDLLPVLSYLHRSGVVHRDISPDNIIWRSHDKLPVLIDLGGVKQIAMNVAYQLAGGKATSTHTRLGKLGYAPDEQMRLGHVAPYSDLYALGVTAVVLMTGKQPQELIDPHTMEWIWEKQLSISYQTRRILNRMLANQPAKRFQSADEILQIIESGGFVEDSSYSLIAPPEVEPVPPKKPKLVAVSAIKTIFTNNSGQGAILDNSLKVPPEIKGWNWGAFFLPGVWCITNRVWIGLLAWTDPTLIMSLALPWLIMGVILGVKGNEWAWKSRKWESIAAFRAHQRAWAIVSFILIGLLLFCLLWIGLIVFVWLGSIGR
ncbi:MAG TPA: serine/threonine protein kinase [Cyanobacteria bacterium UBA11369]|nr:serine/threonine protein kinase [Cyanobacteria bacterium UBA11371]HBE30631.1 serine/threonine protein kinase [Cyanobacteria bacterium UBA11368]HBE52850.1 serine/threonine protein kinase [Cyanobacteria bacterium UBA11369]